MATYKQIQNYIKNTYGKTVKSCWIADVKEQLGLPFKRSPRRTGERVYLCPDNVKPLIQEAFEHFGDI